MAQTRLAQHHPIKLRELVGMPQEVFRVSVVVTHQAAQRRAVTLPVMHAQCVCRRFIQLQILLQRGGHAAVEVRKNVRRRIMQRIVQIKNPDPLRHFYLLLISVPTPSSVRISSSSACSTRPSMICTDFTPLRAASSAEPIFGNMPPDNVPSATRLSMSFGVKPESRLPSLSSTPGVLVSSTSFSALSTSASLPATRSALMFSVSPSGATPIGAITGMKSPESRNVIMDGSIPA